MRSDVDLAILGAGCAGLSLAAALSDHRVPGEVLLLEPRTSYVRDRTWCFWNSEEHPFSSEISHSWSSWRVSHGRTTVMQQSHRYRYCHIAGDDFYRAAIDRVERQPAQTLCRGVTVHLVASHPGGLMAIETSNGRLLAKRVFDGRPDPGNSAVPPALVQRFVGWRVRTAEPCFDAETVDLMGLLPADEPGRVRFVYVLPFSTTEALVEMTYLDDPSLPEPPYHRDLHAWMEERSRDWELLYTENGSLPMHAGAPCQPGLSNVHLIGTRGARIKPSSGYAFLRIQRHSRAIAEALLAGRPIPSRAEPQIYKTLDVIFLRAVRRSPAVAATLFLRMFARTRPDELVRFLGERSRPAEMLRVAWSLPKLPMAHAAVMAGLGAVRAAMMQPANSGAGR